MTKFNKKLTHLTLVFLALSSLAACTKNESSNNLPSNDKAQPAPSLADLGNKAAVIQAVDARLQKGDSSTPLTNYRKIDSGNQVMFLYFGLLNLPVDYEKVVKSYSNEYQQTSDSFKKKDILSALQPKIDQEITQAKAARYLLLEGKGSSLLERYDFNKKSFAVK